MVINMLLDVFMLLYIFFGEKFCHNKKKSHSQNSKFVFDVFILHTYKLYLFTIIPHIHTQNTFVIY